MRFPSQLTEKIKFTKVSDKSAHADLFGAFNMDETLTYTLTVPRALGASSPYMEIYRDDDGQTLVRYFKWCDSDYVNDVYILSIKLSEICSDSDGGLFFYTAVFESGFGKIRLSFNRESYLPLALWYDDDYEAYQLTLFKGYNPPSFIRGGTIYQIFVDRYKKGGDVPVRKDAVLNDDWYGGTPPYARVPGEPLDNNVFFGGTLYGVCEKLDYIKSLGVSCIYLNPIFEAYSNHKYDTGDYSKVDEMFGGDEALELLISEARNKDIAIILDGVFNHTGSDSIYFNREGRYDSVGAYNSKNSEYYDWYNFEEYPHKYRCWWGVDVLPAVDTSNSSFDNMINGEDGIIKKYIKKGISGWRLDVADELQEVFLKRLYKAVKSERPDALVLGEVWEDASNKISYGKRRHYFREELDSVMNYPIRSAIIDFLVNGNDKAVFAAAHTIYSHYPKNASDSLMNLLGTHDTARILTVLAGVSLDGMTPDEQARLKLSEMERALAKERLKLAYLILSTLPGVPSLYYGDEIGMEGGKDPFNRKPYPWGREDKDILSFFKMVGNMRKDEALFSDGYFMLDENTPSGVLSYRRFNDRESITVTVNMSSERYDLCIYGEDVFSGNIFDGAHSLRPGEFAVVKNIL